MSDETVKVEIVGESRSAVDAVRAAADSVRSGVSDMKAQFESLSGAVESIKSAFLGLTAVLAGGKLFGDAIEKTVDWADGVRKLSLALGITSEQASIYQAALTHIGSSSDDLIGATQLMTRALAAHGKEFEQLGVYAHAADGSMRPILDVFHDALDVLRAIDDPIQRNIAGVELFGRGWGNVRQMLELTNDVMQTSAERARALGLVLGDEAVKQAHEFHEQLNDLNLVTTSFSQQIGSALIPALSQAGAAFVSAAPQIGEVFGTVIKGVAYGVIELGAGLEELGVHVGGLLAATTAAIKGNFGEAHTILQEMEKDIQSVEDHATEMQAKLFGGAGGASGGGGGGGWAGGGGGAPGEAGWSPGSIGSKMGRVFDPTKLNDAYAMLDKRQTDDALNAGNKLPEVKTFDPKKLEEAYKMADLLDAKSNATRLQQWQGFFNGIYSGFNQVLAGFLQGTRSLASLFKGVFDSILASVANVLAGIAAQWIQTHIMARIAARLTATTNVQAHAAEAGAAGIASMAAAPWPLDMGAPAFGAAMAAAAGSFSGIAAAEKGFDVPSGVTPLTLLHPREMVLPAGIADQVRDAANGGGGGATVSLKIERLNASHGIVRMSDLAGLLKRLNNNFAFG
jgi:hypothetical protein